MKKNLGLRYGRLLSVLFALCTLFSACSDSDDNVGKEEEKPVTALASYSFKITQDYFDLVDVAVTYWNEDGEQKTETLTSAIWKKKFTIDQSQRIGYVVTVTAKSNLDELLTTHSYNLGYEYEDSYFNTIGSGNSFNSSTSMTVPKTKIKEFIQKANPLHTFSARWDKEDKKFVTE